MKNKLLMLFVFVGFLSSFALIQNSDALRDVLTVEEMSKRSDAIAIGTIESTWIDVRPFDDYIVVDTAKIKVDEWIKNNKNSDTLEIRYYGYWAKTIDDLRGKFIFDNPLFSYESGQKVLLILDHEENTSVMGGGYYPFFEGSFVINYDVAISQADEQTTLQHLYEIITNNVDDTSTEILSDGESKAESDKEPVEHFCAYIGFKKYPENLFAEFLENPYNKDVTFLNFTYDELKQIPEFYELILEVDKMDYPLNKRVRFDVSAEELLKIKEHMEKRPYHKFTPSGETLTDQLGTRDIDGHYRHPDILIDGNLYGINGLNSSPIPAGQPETLNVQLQGSLEEIKDWFIEQNNPNNPGIYYFEINEEDKIHLAVVLDAIDQIQKTKDKIRLSEDVGGVIQDKTQDFFMEQNMLQFNNDNSKYTRYFVLNGTLYETSFVIC